MSEALVVDPRVTIPAEELSWTAVRASGSGGQNVNKVSSKVQLRFDAASSTALDAATRARLLALAGSRADRAGVVTIESQATRDQRRNVEDARAKLADLVRRSLERPKARRATRPTRSSQRARLDDKARRGRTKRDRRGGDD
jgi:ribosome-associated protein